MQNREASLSAVLFSTLLEKIRRSMFEVTAKCVKKQFLFMPERACYPHQPAVSSDKTEVRGLFLRHSESSLQFDISTWYRAIGALQRVDNTVVLFNVILSDGIYSG